MRTFISVAQMKLSRLEAGQNCSTQGYYTPGDGGGALYLTAANAVVDGYGDHELANGAIAILQRDEGTANAMQFGAVGDGVADDTIPINTATRLLYDEHQGGEVFLPAGTYLITAEISLWGSVSLKGSGMLSTIIKTTASIVMVQMQSSVSGEVLNGCWVDSLQLDGGNIANGATGVQTQKVIAGAGIESSRQCGIRNTSITLCATAVHFGATQQFAVYDCQIISNDFGFYIYTDSDNSGELAEVAQLVEVNNTDFRSNVTPIDGEYIQGSKPYHWMFNNCHFEINTNGLNLHNVLMSRSAFYSCKFEQNGYALNLRKSDVLLFDSCIFNANPLTGGTHQILCDNADQGLSINHGWFTFRSCIWIGGDGVKDYSFINTNSVTFDACNVNVAGDNIDSTIVFNNGASGTFPPEKSNSSLLKAMLWVTGDDGTTDIELTKMLRSASGQENIFIDKVEIWIEETFQQTGGTYVRITVGTDASRAAIAQGDVHVLSQDYAVISYTRRGFHALSSDTLSVSMLAGGGGTITPGVGKALVILTYYPVPLLPV